jgi:hypothetical protein
MENENSKLFNKLILYFLAIIFPCIALIVAIILDYGKNNDNFTDRIKLISLYEIFDFLIIATAFIFGGIENLKISILLLVIFYSLLCGIVAYTKKDYVSRGIFLGLFSNHYCLAIMCTSNESTSRIDGAKWPDIGLSMILMNFKIIYILAIYFFMNNFIPKIMEIGGNYFELISKS